MRRVYVLTVLIFAVFISFFVSAWAQEDIAFIDNSIFEGPQRPSSVFAHEDHNETAGIDDCTECHHVYDENGVKSEDEDSIDLACMDCHDFEAEGRTPGLLTAYHLNCKGCHLKEKKGPIMCGECHVKEDKTINNR